MAFAFACPGCAAPFNVTEKMAGKRAKCPKCNIVFTLPAATPASVKAGVKAAPPAPPPVPPPVSDLFPKSDRSDAKSSRRSSRDDDDYDDRDAARPRRAKTRRAKSSATPWILAGVGIALVLFLMCGGTIAILGFIGWGEANKAKPPPAAAAPGGQIQLKQGSATRVQLVNGRFEVSSQLTAQDVFDPDGKRHRCKLYQIELTAGRTYVIDMTSPNTQRLDPYLRVEDMNENVLAEDDDSGGNLNARITYVARHTGAHVIVATAFNPDQLGPFTLTVRELGK
jgi:predicted Zn finger-like uncharacterized protein